MREELKLENYRPTMTADVLHSWAADAQAELVMLRAELSALKGQGVTRADAEQFLAAYHAEVWAAAEDEDSRVAYDDAGRELAKGFFARFGDSTVSAATSDVIHHAFSRDRNIGWNAPKDEQALRALFDAWLIKSQCTRPNSPWDIWKACAKSLNAALARPEQTEQQPVAYALDVKDYVRLLFISLASAEDSARHYSEERGREVSITPLYAAPIAQTAPDDGMRVLLERVLPYLSDTPDLVQIGAEVLAEELRALLAKGVV